MSTEETHLIHIPTGLTESEFPEMISISIICRLCANQSDKLIGIYSEDGVNNDLAGKMNLYLPVKVTETDNLPLQCCWQCASTVLAWHDLVVTSVEADRRLKSYQFVSEKQLEEITSSYGGTESILTANADEALVAAESISKHSISYETITAAEFLIEDTASQIEESSEKSIDNNLANSSEINNIGNDIYISVRKDITTDETELNFNPPSTQAVPLKEETRSTEKADSSSSSSEQSDVEEEHIYKFECLYCPTLFIAQSDVLQHLKDEHPDEGREIVLLNDNETQQNPKSEINKEPVKTEPEETDTKKKPGRRSFHVRYMTKHPLPKINQEEVNKAKVEVDGRVFYMCKQCGKSLHSMYTYVWHTRIHTGERPYVCNLCNKQFRVSQGLVRHLKETHERIKNFDCDICGRRFATRRNVEEHRRIHTNERPYVCATCGKSFKQKASLFVHNRSHSTEFPFSCSDCPQKFRTKPSLLVHVTKHTGEKPFPCDVCGRNFRIKYELKRHKLIHSDDKPFTCKICTQSFRQKRYLRNHLKLNHNISNPNEWLEEYINAI